ncbi:Uncharacterized protein SLP1 [Tolypocladium ophioglossoides CBS 100239]|uniref:Uncharacterized protein SLP1 n=1 Tax=Tolypocladium ophioglossoides (strain CBS 100239) TaxID=1163406 RepID=A0A0L0NFW5_TOLOC|nr:Uncharacterized protein SLP1 [Tolypocladium ophioglossoides CBS 100239]
MVLAVPLMRGLTTLLAVLSSLALAQADERGTRTQTQASSSRADTITGSVKGGAAASSPASSPASSFPSSSSPSLCEARTINYITHRLPQSCLTSSWASHRSSLSEPSASNATHPSAGNGTLQSEPERSSAKAAAATSSDTEATEAQTADLAATTFMSFEDWKEMMLRRAGQDPQEWRSRKPSEHQADDRYPPDMGHVGLGEEDEISLNFDHYADGDDKGLTADTAGGDGSDDKNPDDGQVYGDGKSATVHRSKDAGKTCKERFSYSSFDAGATILKTAAGAKNARAVLVENKDSYMLLECAAPSKYVIVELSDDILVDTIVLANFEFFSSMIRHFRVSVSDRYPVKAEKWRELSTFEARNSRDIQPFLVDNPQIWAKYVRIEFLTHYGNEYYCPVSLLRVHGSRMLDSWKDSETGRDEDPQIEGDEAPANLIHADVTPSPAVPTAAADEAQKNASRPVDITPWMRKVDVNPFEALAATCPTASGHIAHTPTADQEANSSEDGGAACQDLASAEKPPGKATPTAKPAKSASPDFKGSLAAPSTAPANSITASSDDRQTVVGNATASSSAGSASGNETPGERGYQNATAVSATKSSSGSAGTGKPRSSGTSGASPASPTVQEGFFNAITKRLQQVESNLTLSLKYVEDQSRHVQEALQRGEQKQHSEVTVFLNDLNQTVLAELRNIRDQYDQIWQSTVLALESQSDRSERDMMALTTRLNLLADEVVFQKRMAIVQAVILLSCLFLVIFSRGVPIPSLAPLADYAANASYAATASPPTPRRDRDLYRTGQQHSQHGKRSLTAAHDALNYAQILSSTEDETLNAVPSSCDAALGPHLVDPQAAASHYQRLSPPLTPSLPDELRTSCAPVSGRDSHGASNGNPPRRSPCLSHINSRKPLPSLPEHPTSLHET